MKNNHPVRMALHVFLSIVILTGSLFSGSAMAAGGQSSNLNDKIGAATNGTSGEPRPTPTTTPAASYQDAPPAPTPTPEVIGNDSEEELHSTNTELAGFGNNFSKSSLRMESSSLPGYDPLENPELQELESRYPQALQGEADSLDQDGIAELYESGASVSDLYAVTILASVYPMSIKELADYQKEHDLQWIEVDDQLKQTFAKSGDTGSVTSDVYSEKAAEEVNKLTVMGSVYAESFSRSLGATSTLMTALSGSIQELLNEQGRKHKEEVNKEQFSGKSQTSETIDPMTGSLTWRSTQISLPGKDGLDLNLGVIYQSNLASQFFPGVNYDYSDRQYINSGAWNTGQDHNYLGLGWRFALPYIDMNGYYDGNGGYYEFIDGKLDTSNASICKLKDYPTGDAKAVFPLGGFTYIEFADGTRQYFGNNNYGSGNSISGVADRFGNTINYWYNNEGNLERIEDSVGRKLVFTYHTLDNYNPQTDPSVTIKVYDRIENGPSARQVNEVNYYQNSIGWNGEKGLASIKVQGGKNTEFNYRTCNIEYNFFGKDLSSPRTGGHGEFMLSTVEFDQNAVIKYDYDYGIHNLGTGGVIKQARVSGRKEGVYKGNSIVYSFNSNISYTNDYTGYPESYDPDQLPAGYHFSSAVSDLQADGSVLRTQTTSFNQDKKRESVETKVLSGPQQGQRILTQYAGYDATYKYNPTLIEQQVYDNDQDTQPEVLYTERSYDSLGYLTSESQPLTANLRNNESLKNKYITRYEYNSPYHFLTSRKWYNDESSEMLSEATSYTSDGRVERFTNANQETIEYTYENNSGGGLIKSTAIKRAGGKQVQKTVTVFGDQFANAYPTEVQQWFNLDTGNPQVVKHTMNYDLGSGRLISQTDGNNQTTTYAYDALGRLILENQPTITTVDNAQYSHKTEYTYTLITSSPNYDAVNEGTRSLKVDAIETITNVATGATRQIKSNTLYNGLGEALLDEQYDNATGRWLFTHYHYNEFGQIQSTTDAGGNILIMGYDGWGRLNRVVDAEGNTHVEEYNPKQRVSIQYIKDEKTGETLNYATIQYDPWGRMLSQKTYKDWPAQNEPIVQTYRYDIAGNMTGYIDPMNHLNDNGVTTTYTYDALSRLSQVQDALNQATRYTYDGNGQIIKITVQARGGNEQTLNTKSYNELGLAVVKQDGASQSESMTYNNLGQLAARSDRNGSIFGYAYDEAGQLKTSSVSGSINGTTQTQKSENVYYGATIPNYQTLRTYTNNNLIALQENNLDSLDRIRHQYSVANSSTAAGSHTAYIRYNWDELSRITEINDNYLNYYVNYNYDKTHLTTVQTDGRQEANHSPTANAQYSYFANSQVKSITYPTLSDGSVLMTQYTYNKALGWVESVKNSKGSSILSSSNYTYDRNGNVISVSEVRNGGAVQTTTYGYDALNRLTSIARPDGSSTTYTYDVRGNRQTLTDSGGTDLNLSDTSYSYDLNNTLKSVTQGGSTTGFDYYSNGLRYLKSNGNTHTQVNYDLNGQVIGEEKLNGNSVVQQSSYVRGDRLLVKKDKTAGKDYYYLYNGHGDVIQIVDTSGNVVNSYSYDAWGNLTSQTEGIENSFKYAGETYDAETGLYYLRARYYDPSLGRFVNEDTVEGEIDNPLSSNLYTYVVNNPLINADPSGNYCVSADGRNAHSGGCSSSSNENRYMSDKMLQSVSMPYILDGVLRGYYRGDGSINFLSNEETSRQTFWKFMSRSDYNEYVWAMPLGDLIISAGVNAILSMPTSSRSSTSKNNSGKSCNCFTAGTKVKTDEGEKNIEDIEVGDKVLSKDEATGEEAYKAVTDTFNHETDEIYSIHVGGQRIESTFNHPFYVKDKGWTFVKDLKVGDLLVQSDGDTLKIDGIELLNKQVTVYNMTVDDFHTYFVSDLGIWVHNIGPCDWRPLTLDDATNAGFKADKKFDGKMVKVPNGKYQGRYGWMDKDGNIWVPAKAGESHGGLQFDVQLKSSKYTKHKNVFVPTD